MPRRNKPASGLPAIGGEKVLYPIHPGVQEMFMTTSAEEVLYGGAAFGGKSYALRAMLVSYCLTYPGAVAVLFRRTFRELEDTHILNLQLELPSYVATYRSSSHDFQFANGSVLMLRFCEKEQDVYTYDCVGTETPILTEDLRWVPAGELKVGDAILGFEEYPDGKKRRALKRATVTRQNIVKALTHRISLANGKVIYATPNHRWLIKGGSGTLEWKRTDELYEWHHSNDARIKKPLTLRQSVPVQRKEESYRAGFLGAAFDGEGCLITSTTHRIGLQLNFTQKPNAMFEQVKKYLDDCGYTYIDYFQEGGSRSVRVLRSGWTAQNLDLLMKTRPPRLLEKWKSRIEDLQVPFVDDIDILDISPLEEHEIAEISSSSKTYFADGFLAHNTFEADIMAFDELTAFSEFQYVYLITRCRSTKKWWPTKNGGPGRRIRAATNPGNVGHSWVKRRFIKFQAPFAISLAPKNQGGLTRQFIPAKAEDNITGMVRDPHYLDVLRGLPDEEYRAKALGDWNVFSGQFFQRWRDAVHVMEDFYVPPHWKRYIFVDWGLAVPRAVYWAAMPENTQSLFIYREQYGAGVSTREQARQAGAATRAAQEKIEMVITDPAMWSRERDADGDYMKSPADYWKDEFSGVCDVTKGNNERIQGASLFRECLDWQGLETSNGITMLVPPRLRVFRSCTEFIRTVPDLVHSTANVEDVDTHGEDHAYDAVRYGLRYLFAAPEQPRAVRVMDTPDGLVFLPA